MSTTTSAAVTDEEHPQVPTPEPRELGAAVSDYIARVRGAPGFVQSRRCRQMSTACRDRCDQDAHERMMLGRGMNGKGMKDSSADHSVALGA